MKTSVNLKGYAQTARQAAAEGAVLLKNDRQALPLKFNEQVAVFGRIQASYYKSGTGSGGLVNTAYTVGILEGLTAQGIKIHQGLQQIYRDWEAQHPFDEGAGWAQEPWSQREMPITSEVVQQIAKEAEVALVILGRTAGEDHDNAAQPGSYLLTNTESELLERVTSSFPRTIVLLNVGNILDMKWVKDHDPAAVLYVWHGGQEGGHAVADILTGAITPCGKLPDTIAQDISDYPAHAFFGDPLRNVYHEDIFVGYRFFETAATQKVLYPFGFGLSYTTFNLVATAQVRGLRLDATVIVTNTGARPGKEVVQLYHEAPQGLLGRPARELSAFAKTPLLAPGESCTLHLEFDLQEAGGYDDDGRTGHPSCYVLETGDYRFYLGTDVRQAKPLATVAVDHLLVVRSCTEALAPKTSFMRLHAQAGTPVLVSESTPERTIDLKSRQQDFAPGLPYAGDKGWKLSDVSEGKIPLETFLSQLTDEDLAQLTLGEGMCSPKVTPGTAAAFGGVTERLKSFGIPLACCADGPSGIRMDNGQLAFSLPNGTCLASTFNLPLVEALHEYLAQELQDNHIDAILGPGINIHRHPLNGRNFEYFSEDPLLTGKMAVACLKGLHRHGVTGVIKHFAANNQETGRKTCDSVVSERALREIYLKGFELAVRQGKARMIMTTYGAINGIWTASNYDLLTVILRQEWGFNGLVMTDWWAAMNDDQDEASLSAASYMVRAQNDIYMVVSDACDTPLLTDLQQALAEKRLARGQLLRVAGNICRVLQELPAMSWLNSPQPWHSETPVTDLGSVTYQKAGQLNLTGLKTAKGSVNVLGLLFDQSGDYEIRLTLRSESTPLAQLPLTFSLSGKHTTTVTVPGRQTEWTDYVYSLGEVRNPSGYLRLFFAQGGLGVKAIHVLKVNATKTGSTPT